MDRAHCVNVIRKLKIASSRSNLVFLNRQNLDPFVVPYRVPDDYEAIRSSWGVYTRGLI